MRNARQIRLKLEKVSVRPPGCDHAVIRNISLQVSAGEWIGLAGRSGSGKSVLARVMAGLTPASEGIVAPRAAEGRPVQLIMQNPDAQLVGETVYEDLCFGLENYGIPQAEMKQACSRALELVGLSGMEEAEVHRLSGGQKQLLALAGAIVLQPEVLIADEVTSMLDPASRERVLAVMQSLHRQGMTIVMATQLLEELVYAERVLALHGGDLVYDGGVRPFFYGTDGWISPAEGLGLVQPLTVRTVQALSRRGMRLPSMPLTTEELADAVAVTAAGGGKRS